MLRGCLSLATLVNFECLKEKFDIPYKFNSVFCLATHWWEPETKIRKEPKKLKRKFLNNSGIAFANIEGFTF